MTALRKGLPSLPVRMRGLPVDDRGYPVPWFVAWIDGKPDFRVPDGEKKEKALRFGRCWLCGETLGADRTFVIGPMCAVNRTTSEPPCHHDCAVFAATACPFLTLPKASRRDSNLPEGHQPAPGNPIPRNPGVTLLWTTRNYSPFKVRGGGWLIRLSGFPLEALWYREGRLASRDEILESINSGFPLLEEVAREEGPEALEALLIARKGIDPLIPA